jgi:hypothetical protein
MDRPHAGQELGPAPLLQTKIHRQQHPEPGGRQRGDAANPSGVRGESQGHEDDEQGISLSRRLSSAAARARQYAGRGHTTLAYGKFLFDWDWRAAEQGFRRAIALNPAYATAHHWYGDYLGGWGNLEGYLHELRRAQALDPLSRQIGTEVGRALYALRWLKQAYELSGLPKPDGSLWHAFRRLWATERKHLPVTDVAAAGGWKDTSTLLKCYQRPDEVTLRSVVEFEPVQSNQTRLSTGSDQA